uniref:Uncharacterized protein n=1 Tax=Odontella aurita TaxID=265563 RepID=A0A7S4IU36_9STRA|mmetsp:Transcript_3032/g.7892  ORF Transcript_3032/g.7892 Transcript_3032/m.7892 type:complete len:171 (+) Transcript_3032:67-579(+)
MQRLAALFFALVSIARFGIPQYADGGNCTLDDSSVATIRDGYDACQSTQGTFGNWKISQQCVSDYYHGCMALNDTQYCTVVRSTNYAFGVCLNASCPKGSCSGPYQCTGSEEEMRKLVGTLDETDRRGCCNEAEDACFKNPNAAQRGRGAGKIFPASTVVAVVLLTMCGF